MLISITTSLVELTVTGLFISIIVIVIGTLFIFLLHKKLERQTSIKNLLKILLAVTNVDNKKGLCSLAILLLYNFLITKTEYITLMSYIISEKPSTTVNSLFFYEDILMNEPGYWWPLDEAGMETRIVFVNHLILKLSL
jgi:hypothetical protein